MVNGTGSRSCPMSNLGIRGGECLFCTVIAVKEISCLATLQELSLVSVLFV